MQFGGAIFFLCAYPYECTVNLLKGNVLNQNYAGIAGGGLYWNDVQPNQIYSDSMSYQNNTGRIYGDNLATYSQKLVKITEKEYEDVFIKVNGYSPNQERMLSNDNNPVDNNKTTQATSSVVNSQRSGGALPTMYISLADMYGIIVASSYNKKLTMTVTTISMNPGQF